MNDTSKRDEALMTLLLEKPAAERTALLEILCGSDPALRQRVKALLAAHETGQGETIPSETKPSIQFDLPDPPDELVGANIGRYKLREKLGEGGCGVVYVAEQEEPVRRKVALKVIKLGMDTKQVVARFEAERQALAMMDHPNIAKVLDGGTTESGRPFFVMELVRGIRITDYCDQNNLGTRERLDLFIQVCQAIQHAHQKGIIHRDIKPSNILVTLHDGVPVPKVIDFGIAKATEGRLTDATVYTQLHQFIGTPAYMSPEQAEMSGLDIDTRSDIYSLGVLLYELLTGKTPFDAKELIDSGIDAMRKTIREKEPMRPSTRLAGLQGEEQTTTAKRRGAEAPKLIHLLRGDLDWVVMKCLEKDRTRRYETANGIAADLKRHLTNEPVTARPPSTAYRMQKAFRRNKLAFAAATAVVVALVAGIGVSTWQMVTARRARAGEHHQRLEAQSAQKVADAQARKASESEQQSRRFLYASDINLADQALKLNNLGKARRLLDRHRPQPGEEDLRGWEWRHLWQLTRSGALLTLTNRTTRGMDLSFSPDGSHLAVGWWDGHVDLWEVPGRRLSRALTEREYPNPGRVAFSPVRNLLAATSEPNVIVLYDLDSGRESILWQAPEESAWKVFRLTFSGDGSRVVIYAGSTPQTGDAVWVVNVSSTRIESHHPIVHSGNGFGGMAPLSPDNRRLYLPRANPLNYLYTIQCIDLAAGKEVWQTESRRDWGLTALVLSPDGRVLASGSGFEDPAIRIWDTGTGRLLFRLDGHTGWVCKLAFTKDGRRLISAASDQSIRFWDTSNWTQTEVLRGHTDEVFALAVSDAAQLVASVSKDGDLMLWKDDEISASHGYNPLPENLREIEVLPLDQSRALFLPSGKPPEIVDLKRNMDRVSLAGIESSTNVLGWFGSNILCHWNGTNQILIRELRGSEFIHHGAVSLTSAIRPSGLAYHPARKLMAWSEGTSSLSVYLQGLGENSRRIELRSDVPGLSLFRFSEDGNYLGAVTAPGDFLRAWNVETGQILVSIGGRINAAAFAAGGRMLVALVSRGNDHEISFYNLAHPGEASRSVALKYPSKTLAVSPDSGLVASSNDNGQVRLFDPIKGEWIGDLHGHMNAARGIAFSADGRRLISASGAREAVKLWDVGTRQELLTLSGTGSMLQAALWSADGDVILVGAPWQAWRAPSWEEIAETEVKQKKEVRRP